MERTKILTAESVTEGHPDKVCDGIADAILDAALERDPRARVACEVLCKGRRVVLAGEITSRASFDREAVVRKTVEEIGYVDPGEEFHASGLEIHDWISEQAPEIASAVGEGADPGAGDQGVMFGYATAETPEQLPLPVVLAHALARALAADRKAGRVPWLRPDGKTQVAVRYEGNVPVAVARVLVSAQHARDVELRTIREYVATLLLPGALGEWNRDGIDVVVNPSGSFVHGGPSADCGVTGRKLMVDSYGGLARHGGGAFSGKDATKVDRSGAYFARFVARAAVDAGLARRVEVQVGYAIGRAEPFSLCVETFGTGDEAGVEAFVRRFDFRPGAILERLGLRRPIYRPTACYGHFGRREFPWEGIGDIPANRKR